MSDISNELYDCRVDMPGNTYFLYDLANWKNGLAFKKIDFSESGIPVIKIAELNNGISVSTSYTNGKYSEDVHLYKGDMVFSWSGNPQTSIDVFWFPLNEGWLNQHIFKITANESIVLKEYLYYLMKSIKPVFTKIASNKQTTGLGHVTIADLKQIKVTIPDIDVQKKIIESIKLLDDKVDCNTQINRNLLEQAKMLFQAWFIDYEHFGGECPSDWKEGILEDVVDFYNGYAFKSKELLDAPDPENECFHVFKQGHINRGGGFNISGTKSWFPKKNAEKLERYVLKKGDILMAMTDMKNNVAILGNTAIMEMDNTYILNQRVALLRPTGKFGIEYPFVSLLTNSTDFVSDLRSRAHSGVQVNLSATEIKSSKLLIPSEKVNYEFNTIVKPMFEAMIEHDMENMRLIELRNTLLPKLMSGELDVSGLDI